MSIGHLRIYRIRKPTTVTAKEITSRQNKKTHGKRKNLTKQCPLGIKESVGLGRVFEVHREIRKCVEFFFSQAFVRLLFVGKKVKENLVSCCPQLWQNIVLPTSFKCSKMAEMAGGDDQTLIPLLHFRIPWCTSKTPPSPHALFYAMRTLLLLFLLPYGYFFCRESFPFVVSFFSFAVSLSLLS